MSSDNVTVVKAFEVGQAIVRLLLDDDDELATVAGTNSTSAAGISVTVVSFTVEVGASQATRS